MCLYILYQIFFVNMWVFAVPLNHYNKSLFLVNIVFYISA